jgi:hypothetical protein
MPPAMPPLPSAPIRATLPRMDLRTLAILDSTATRLDELIHVCRRLGVVYARDHALTEAEIVTRCLHFATQDSRTRCR